jgi:hypothetical protein
MLMQERVGELKRGHLAAEEADSSPGAVHWFEGMCVCACVRVHRSGAHNCKVESSSLAYAPVEIGVVFLSPLPCGGRSPSNTSPHHQQLQMGTNPLQCGQRQWGSYRTYLTC